MIKVQVKYYGDDSKVSIEHDYISDTYEFDKLEGIDIYDLLWRALGNTSKNIFKDLDSETILLGLRFAVTEDGNDNCTDEYDYKDFYELVSVSDTKTITLRNIKGLYIGDICYALEDDVYDGVWGKNDYESGKYETEDGLQFAVDNTYCGDGLYESSDGEFYPVDAGVIGVVDLRLATKSSIDELKRLGKVIPEADMVEFFAEDGVFEITVYKDNEDIYTTEIDTRDYDEDEE